MSFDADYDPTTNYTTTDQSKPPPGMPDLFPWFQKPPKHPKLITDIKRPEKERLAIQFPEDLDENGQPKEVFLTPTEYAVIFLLWAKLKDPNPNSNPEIQLNHENVERMRSKICKLMSLSNPFPKKTAASKSIIITALSSIRKKFKDGGITSWVIPEMFGGNSASTTDFLKLWDRQSYESYLWLRRQDFFPSKATFWFTDQYGLDHVFLRGCRLYDGYKNNPERKIRPAVLTIIKAYIAKYELGPVDPQAPKLDYDSLKTTVGHNSDEKTDVLVSLARSCLRAAELRAAEAGIAWDLPDTNLYFLGRVHRRHRLRKPANG